LIVATLALLVVGCPSNSATSPSSATEDIAVESRFPWGAYRQDLEARYGAPKLNWVVDNLPDDEFAAATMREIVGARKPKPTSYQVFPTRRADGRGFYSDYVFYTSQGRVIYAVRRG
jgi:hypothetical protein